MIIPDFLEFKRARQAKINFLQHSAKGTTWSKEDHKYVKKENGRYYYEDARSVNERKKEKDKLERVKERIGEDYSFDDVDYKIAGYNFDDDAWSLFGADGNSYFDRMDGKGPYTTTIYSNNEGKETTRKETYVKDSEEVWKYKDPEEGWKIIDTEKRETLNNPKNRNKK